MFLPEYNAISIKGSGSFGYVVEAYDKKHNVKVAVKRTHKVGNKISREYEILSLVRECPFCVKLFDIFYTKDDENRVIQNLVFESIPHNLDNYMVKHQKAKKIIPIDKIKKISKQLLLGLNYCHQKNIVHRDLKPENILFTEDETVKICDFGSSKIIEYKIKGNKKINITKSTPYIVSRFYRAPELIFGKVDYDSKIDIFAAGCILAELFTCVPLFPGLNEGLQILEYINVLGKPDNNYFQQFNIPDSFLEFIKNYKNFKVYPLNMILNSDGKYSKKDVEEACDLLQNMLKWNFNKRFTAEQCLNHNFLKNVDLK